MARTLTSSASALFFAQIVSNITVLNFLQALGYAHTKEELLASELDILKSLNFQINLPTPLAYVEMLLEVLGTLLNVSDVGCILPQQAKNNKCAQGFGNRRHSLPMRSSRKEACVSG